MENGLGIIDWDKTLSVQDRLEGDPAYEEPSRESRHGRWHGRNIIGRDSPTNGGVYLGGGEREAVVVDDRQQPGLAAAYQGLLRRKQARGQQGENFRANLLGEVFALTRELLPFNRATVDRLTQGLGPDQEIPLSAFIGNQGGACRHQALLCAYLLEKLKTDGYARGRVSIDRNYVAGIGGHAWVRYVNSRGEVFIIDPARNYVGWIEDIERGQTFYRRPEELSRRARNLLMGGK